MNKLVTKYLLSCLFALSSLLTPVALGQGVASSTISGVVLDPSGKPANGALVTIVHTPTNSTVTTLTNASTPSRVITVTVNLNVATPAGVMKDLIEHGVNGFLAETPEEWSECLARLLENAELRCRMGVRARESIAGQCSASEWAPVVGRILRSAAAVPESRSKRGSI